ncbi:actin bundling protein [Planoprotostelium fungivorum]|uniref:Actin bundling protein n=1 Tax=Planoprotostelium fungivorum TaxID=1890364 RepID=A0A2P6NS97_9EUKA|nr:actin bundling protein [Planoprotostelium fungivorum]
MSASEKGWEKVQIRAFTAWLNGYLEQRSMPVENIHTDMDDGVRLINFLELLSSKKVQSKWNPKPPSRIQKIENLHIGLTFLDKDLKVKTSGASAEDFADHNLKMILGFFYTLYKRYRIATIKVQDKSSEEGLLLWCKQKTEGYRDVEIENFRHSFKDGMAFGALCDAYLESNKETIDYDKFQKGQPLDNLTSAFEIATKHLGLPKLLDEADVLEGNIDERSMVLYVSLFFHAFTAKDAQRAADAEKNKIELQVKGLQGTLEERARMAAQLEEDNKSLRERISALERELTEERGAREFAESEIERLRAELEKEKEKNRELAAKGSKLEAQVFSLEGQVSEMSEKFTALERKGKSDKDKLDGDSAVQTKGLNVLKQNLEEHLEDLHRWQAYLDFDKISDVDFAGEIRPQILADITKDNFETQLTKLSEKLEKENGELLALLKSKEAEKSTNAAREAEKKARAKN